MFVGKCLAIASDRPSAAELLMDPFLAPDEDKAPVSPCHEDCLLASALLRIPIPSDNGHKSISQPLTKASTKNTKMMITGTMNPEDDTIFLKVMISDKNGNYLNFHYPLWPYRFHKYNAVILLMGSINIVCLTSYD